MQRLTARALAQVLHATITTVASTAPRSLYVSQDVLVTALPRPDLVKSKLVAGRLVDHFWSVTRIAAGTRMEDGGGPLLVGDRAVVAALEPEDGPPGPSDKMVGVRIVRLLENDGDRLELYLLDDPHAGIAYGFPAM